MQETIVALATPSGVGAIGVIRLSGSGAFQVANRVFKGKNLSNQESHTIHFGTIRTEDGQILDEVLAFIFKGPNSYTGEDIIEFSCHGSPYIIDQILQLMIRNGARFAKPGEFTMRAYLNGKLDLSQAEAVGDLIAASSAGEHQFAMQQMRGGISKEISGLRQQLLDFASLIELELDFGEEDVDFADRKALSDLVDQIHGLVQKLIDSFSFGNAVKQGINTVIAGRPNAGKSTLLNALLNESRAIVSDIAGTTRDTIEEEMVIDGIRFRFIDTAGLRETQDEVERLGIARTWAEIERAQVVLLLRDATARVAIDRNFENEVLARAPSGCSVIEVVNKSDLLVSQNVLPTLEGNERVVASRILISAKTGFGLNELRQQLLAAAGLVGESSVGIFSARTRHLQALVAARLALHQAAGHLRQRELELLAEGLRQAQQALAAITGEFSADDLLGEIFGSFCIGK